MNNREWFKQAGYGMMIHFGLYSLIGGEWRGARMPFIGEWAQSYFRIPGSEYGQLRQAFNPLLFDAEEWVKTAQDAGMQYMVVTSKHHDGFCLFHTKWDDYNVVDGTPFKRDIIEELANACARHGLKLGLYYSEELDWHEPDGGGYTFGHTNCGVMSWTNDWDFPENGKKDYARCFEGKIKTQMKEILTQYGDLCLIWCDTPMDIKPAQSRELYDMIKHYQPDCLVNSRIGNGLGDYRSTGDNEEAFDTAEGAGNAPDSRPGEALVRTGLYECPATLNDTWGYKPFDQNWKSPDRVRELRRSLNARGINYLLNIGPDPLGRLPAPAVDVLRRAAE